MDIYGILEILRQELRVMEGLHSIGVGNKRLATLLALDFSDSSGTDEFAIDIRDSAISWINDIENDSRYNRWSNSLMELLRPTFPGMLRQVRRNLFNLVRKKIFFLSSFRYLQNIRLSDMHCYIN